MKILFTCITLLTLFLFTGCTTHTTYLESNFTMPDSYTFIGKENSLNGNASVSNTKDSSLSNKATNTKDSLHVNNKTNNESNIDTSWWKNFNSPTLVSLIEEAKKNSPD
ncbi:MAG: hypothetical protein ACK5LP_01690, partial [Campylobacteraceae bacterium]